MPPPRSDSPSVPVSVTVRRRRRTRPLVAGAAVVAAAIVIAYGVQLTSRFVRQERGTLVVYSGVPSFTLPGLPRRLLSLHQQPEGLLLPPSTEPTRVVVAVGPGGDTAAALRAITKPAVVAMERYGMGDPAGARAAALRLFEAPDTTNEQRLLAWLVLGEVAGPGDTDRFPPLLASQRVELREVGARALFRLDPTRALASVESMRPDWFEAALPRALRELRPPCTTAHLALLGRAFRSTGSSPTNADIVEAALRSGCRPAVAMLMDGVRRSLFDGVRPVVILARYRGDEVQLAAAIDAALGEPDLGEWRRGTLTATLLALGRGACSGALRGGLASGDAATRLATMAALAQFCAGARFDVVWNPSSHAFDATLTSGRDVQRVTDIGGTGLQDDMPLRRLLLVLPEVTGALQGLRALQAGARDDALRETLIDALVERGDAEPLPRALIDGNSIEVRRAAVDHWRAIAEREVVRDLIPRLDGADDAFAPLLGRIPLRREELAQVRARLSGVPAQQRHAACVLAMQGDPDEVVRLLTSAEAELRTQTADCLPFNRQAGAIVARTPQAIDGFPLTWLATARERIARKQALVDELQGMPAESRLWTAASLDGRLGGWGPGMRAWLNEQTFLERLRRRGDSTRVGQVSSENRPAGRSRTSTPAAAARAVAPITISGPSTSAGRGLTASRPASCAAKMRVSASVAGCRSLPGGSSMVTTPATPPAVTIGTTSAPGASAVPRTERASPRVNAVATGVSLESGIVPIRPSAVDV